MTNQDSKIPGRKRNGSGRRLFNFPFQRKENVNSREEIQQSLEDNFDAIRTVIRKYFYIYDSQNIHGTLGFFVSTEPEKLDLSFENARVELKGLGFLATLLREKGELVLYVFKAPPAKKRSLKWNVIMFIATLASTIWAGTLMWASYVGYDSNLEGPIGMFLEIFEVLIHPRMVFFGAISFAFPILLILGLHEAGHYIASKRNNVDASLPFFIPVPPPFILGTMGAFITIKEPIPSKKALMQIGAAGPIVGLLVAIPVTIVGFMLSEAYPGASIEADTLQVMVLGEPLLYKVISSFFTLSGENVWHPTAFAGWVGLLVTAFNLLPAGQLDGGHIARALFGRNARYFSYLSIVALLIMGYWYRGWFIFAFLILILGLRHPPPLNDISPLKFKEKIIGFLSIGILIICFIPIPMEVINFEPKNPELLLSTADLCMSVDRGGILIFPIAANNSGNREGEFHFVISVEYERVEEVNITALRFWNVSVRYTTGPGSMEEMQLNLSEFHRNNRIGEFQVSIPERSVEFINISLEPNSRLPYGTELRLNISGREKEHSNAKSYKVICARVSSLELYAPITYKKVLVEGNVPNWANFIVTATNIGSVNDTFYLNHEQTADWKAWLNMSSTVNLGSGENNSFFLRVQPPMLPAENMIAHIELSAVSGNNNDVVEVLRFTVEMKKKIS